MKAKLMIMLVEAISEETLLDMLKASLDEYMLLKTEETEKMLLLNAIL